MLRPSQIPGRKAEAQETPHLLSRLATLDKAIVSDFRFIVALSTLHAETFLAQYAKAIRDADGVAASKARLVDFRRKGEMDEAIRYVLYERGVLQAAARLDLSQEEIANRLDSVRMLAARTRLDLSLTMLEQNCSLDDLPAKVDVIELSGDEEAVAGAPEPEPPMAHATEPAAPVKPAEPSPPPATSLPEAAPRRRSFWQRLRLWLSSPWTVRWRYGYRSDWWRSRPSASPGWRPAHRCRFRRCRRRWERHCRERARRVR
jgi:hypothetical protein